MTILSDIVQFFRPPVMTYKESAFVSDVARLVLSESWDSFGGDEYFIKLENERYLVEFWVKNKPYDYFSEGVIVNKKTGLRAPWTVEMPSRELVFAVDEKFRKISELNQIRYEIEKGIARRNLFGEKDC